MDRCSFKIVLKFFSFVNYNFADQKKSKLWIHRLARKCIHAFAFRCIYSTPFLWYWNPNSILVSGMWRFRRASLLAFSHTAFLSRSYFVETIDTVKDVKQCVTVWCRIINAQECTIHILPHDITQAVHPCTTSTSDLRLSLPEWLEPCSESKKYVINNNNINNNSVRRVEASQRSESHCGYMPMRSGDEGGRQLPGSSVQGAVCLGKLRSLKQSSWDTGCALNWMEVLLRVMLDGISCCGIVEMEVCRPSDVFHTSVEEIG